VGECHHQEGYGQELECAELVDKHMGKLYILSRRIPVIHASLFIATIELLLLITNPVIQRLSSPIAFKCLFFNIISWLTMQISCKW